MLKSLFFKLFVFFKGVKFFKYDTALQQTEFKKAVFKTVGDHNLEFLFYKQVAEDLVYRRGRVTRHSFVGYVIQLKVDENLPAEIYKYNNLKFFFKNQSYFVKDENQIASLLLNIYLDYIRKEMVKYGLLK